MRNRYFIIMSCTCLLGMTVLQALAVPCCCKTHSLNTCAKHPSAGRLSPPKKTCSHTAHSKARSNLANHTGLEEKFQTTISHKCRCVEPAQIVDLSTQTSDAGIRLPSAPLAAQTPTLFSQPAHGVGFLPDLGSPSIALHIATCPLRC